MPALIEKEVGLMRSECERHHPGQKGITEFNIGRDRHGDGISKLIQNSVQGSGDPQVEFVENNPDLAGIPRCYSEGLLPLFR